tara:strand:+ start:4589 stop:4963 length:375 start_codon:yes stop_codon:yes gene_type:complete
MRKSPYNYQDSYNDEPYLRREGILNQWIKVMGNCGRLLLVGLDWIYVYVEEQAHKLPRVTFPNLRKYKNERIECKAIEDYVSDIETREPLIDVDSPILVDSKHIPKTNGHERLANGQPIYCETP